MSSQFEANDQFMKNAHEVIGTEHTLAIRYHRFQDYYRDKPLQTGTHCYIVFDDSRHQPYLVSAIITNVDKKTQKYTIQRMNDNEIETYHWHQIVVAYDKNIHSINIADHKQSIQALRDANNEKNKKKVQKNNKNKRKRKRNQNQTQMKNEITNNNINNSNNNNDNNNELDDQNRPNKKRKLNDMTASNINTSNTNNSNNTTNSNNSNKAKNNNRPNHGVLTLAQPYFPIPHPYFRQNALLTWKKTKNTENKNNGPIDDTDVGRVVDFDMDKDIVYIQNTYRCGTQDDEDTDLLAVHWNEWQQKTSAKFVGGSYLYQLKQPVLYWWDRPGCGSICEDKIESLDYGAQKDLLYGITGGKRKKKVQYKDVQLKWVHKNGLLQSTPKNKSIFCKYISRSFRASYPKPKKNVSKDKIYDAVIIGAGMAGLTTQWALHRIDQQYKIKILEAQDYIGGRLKSHTFPPKNVTDPINTNVYKLPAVSVELGAAFLSGSGKDNRFWNWLKQKEKTVCADWGGYNNGWWNGDSFIDSDLGEFVSDIIIERIKNICDDIQILCCKLLMPLDDMAVIDGLEYLKWRIPKEQLFRMDKEQDENIRPAIEKYFYFVYDKYKILSANWVGPQGLWQQQQTVELQNLDFEALYKFLRAIFGSNNKKAKKWLSATEKLIMDYYGDKTNIKTQNFNVYAKQQYNGDMYDMDMDNDNDDMNENIIVMNGKSENVNEDYNKYDDDSEATESERSESRTLSPSPSLMQTKHNTNRNHNTNHNGYVHGAGVAMKLKFSSDDVKLGDKFVIKYDKSDYGEEIEYQFKFGFRDILVRDIIHPPHEEEAADFEKTTGLNSDDYQRFKNALEHLADCNLFSYHLYFLRCNQSRRNDAKVKKLLERFKEDIDLFDSAIEDFKNILSGKELDGSSDSNKPQRYKGNRKSMAGPNTTTTMSPKNTERILMNNLNGHVTVNEIEQKEEKMNHEIHNNLAAILPKLDSVANINIENMDNIIQNIITDSVHVKQDVQLQMKPEIKKQIPNDHNIEEAQLQDMDSDTSIPMPSPSIRKKRRHKKHKNKRRSHKKKKKKIKTESMDSNDSDISEYERIDIQTHFEFKQDNFDRELSLNANAPNVGDGFVTHGYSQVLEAFTCDINNNKDIINTNYQVTAIERIRDVKYGELCEIHGIDLVTGKPFKLWARFAAVTVPLGVLKLSLDTPKQRDVGINHSGIKFKPPLSVEKQQAIEAMGMGCENKVYLRFTKCFWPRDKPYFQSIQHPEYRFINLSYKGFKLPVNTNVLCTMIPPTVGKKWYVQNPAQELRIVWDVLRVLNKMFKVRENVNVNVSNDVIMNDKVKEVKEINDNNNVKMNGHTAINNINNNIKNNVNDDVNKNNINDTTKNNNSTDIIMTEKSNNNNKCINESKEEISQQSKDTITKDVIIHNNNNNNNINESKEEIDKPSKDANFKDVMMHQYNNQYNNDKKEEDECVSNYDKSNAQRQCKLINKTEEIAELLQMLVDYKVTDWEHNIFTRGSYSYLPKGAIYTHCKSLQKYDGNGIYFCGEATSIEGFECVDGAHETGFNVAKEIHKQLQKMRLQDNRH